MKTNFTFNEGNYKVSLDILGSQNKLMSKYIIEYWYIMYSIIYFVITEYWYHVKTEEII